MTKMTLGIILLVFGLGSAGLGVRLIMQAKSPQPEVQQEKEAASQEEEPKQKEKQPEVQPEITGPPPLATSSENNEEEATNYEKGRQFEEFTVSRFNPGYFAITEWRGDKVAADGRFAESNRYPDLEMELRVQNQRLMLVSGRPHLTNNQFH